MTSSTNKDQIYLHQKSNPDDFQFNKKVAEVFDDMLARSVPCYRLTIDMIVEIIRKFLQKNDVVYDLGCSTGTTLLDLARHTADMELQFVGVDNSEAMIEKAVLKAEMYAKSSAVHFQKANILEVKFQQAGAIILNYTLQFIRPMQRAALLQRLYENLRPGGILLLSEKTIFADPAINRSFIDFYYNFKRAQGYSEIEITKKREALENVLVPFSIAENKTLLQEAGFQTIETFFQWFNFVSIVAVKGE